MEPSKKKYSNKLIMWLDYILFYGKYFIEYEMYDKENKLIFKTKGNINPFKRRIFDIQYYEQDNKHQFFIQDEKIFGIVEKTKFNFEGKTFHIEKVPMEWAKMTVDGKLIAEWHVPVLQPPWTCNFKLYDLEYENRVLLLIGIFHTYYHAM